MFVPSVYAGLKGGGGHAKVCVTVRQVWTNSICALIGETGVYVWGRWRHEGVSIYCVVPCSIPSLEMTGKFAAYMSWVVDL